MSQVRQYSIGDVFKSTTFGERAFFIGTALLSGPIGFAFGMYTAKSYVDLSVSPFLYFKGNRIGELWPPLVLYLARWEYLFASPTPPFNV